MELMKNKYYKMLMGILFGSIFLWLALRGINFKEVRYILININYIYFIIAFILGGLEFTIRAYRWQVLLSPIKNIRFGKLFSALTIGYTANLFLPIHGGEIVKANILGYTEKIPKSTVFATIVVKRIIDIFILFIIFIVSLGFVLLPNEIKNLSFIMFSIGIFMLLFILFLLLKPNFMVKLFGFLPRMLNQKIQGLFSSFLEGLKVIKERKVLCHVFLISLFIWLYVTTQHYLIFHALGIQLSFSVAIVITFILSIGISMPTAPGFIGTVQYFSIIGLSIFNIPKNTALSFSVLAHVVDFLPVVIIGLVCTQKLGFSILNGKRS